MNRFLKIILPIVVALAALAFPVALKAEDPIDPQLKCCTKTTNPGMPTSFFGMTQNQFGGNHDTVGIQYGVLRFWDTACVWGLIETSPGTYNFTSCDTEINRAVAMNAIPVFVLGRTPVAQITGTCTGIFSGGSPKTCAQLPKDLGGANTILPAFLTALYNHIHSAYPGMTWYIEGLNEADLAGECAPSTGGSGHCSAVELVKYQQTLYQTIKALDNTIIVIGPAASTANQFGPHLYNGVDATSAPFNGNGFLNAGGGAWLDWINIHPYFFCGGSASCTVPETAIGMISALKTVLTTYGVQNKPVVMSESDWGTGTANTQAANLKAAYLGRLYAYLWNAGYIGVWWYAWDNNATNLSIGFGTLCEGSPCTPNSSATAYATWYGWLVGSTHAVNGCDPNNDGHNTWFCSLVQSGGVHAAIIFNASGPRSFSTTGLGFTTQYFQDGTSAPIVSNTVTADIQPILVK